MSVLTKREMQIAEYVAKDKSEKMIAAELFISPGTVHKHTSNIRKKWKVNTAVGIAVKYLQTLENPKNFVLGCVFLSIQSLIIFSNQDLQVRKVRTARRVVKIRKNENI